MSTNIGIKELAKIAKVSIGTIDRVIHNRPGVSAKTRERVLKIIEKYNYKPNLLAKHLASKKAFRIAVLMPSVEDNPVWQPYADGLTRAQRDMEKFSVTVDHLSFDQYNPSSFEALYPQATTYDAVMMVPLFKDKAVSLQQLLQQQGKTCLYFDTNIPHESSHLFIGQNAHQAGRLSASLMNYAVPKDKSLLIINLGKKAGYHLNFWGREKGFKQYIEEQKHDQRSLLTYEGPIEHADHLEQGLVRCLQRNPAIGGIFVPNSRVHWVAHLLAKLNRQELILMGFDLIPDNISFLKKGVIDFLINQHPEQQAYRGAEWLTQNLVFGNTENQLQAVPIDIVMRENM